MVAPSQMTEITFERRQEKMEVTRCEKGKSIGAGYKEKEVQICKQAYEEVQYRLPAIIENVDDFLELNIPEPSLSCQVYRFEIPEVMCQVCFLWIMDLLHISYHAGCYHQRVL